MLMVMMTNNCKCVEKKNQHERQKQRKKKLNKQVKQSKLV